MESPLPATQSPPSSASSRCSRRASLSSVTSSGRRRKGQSLSDLASSLGKRTPERSLRSPEGPVTRSRQLDFYSDGVEQPQEDSDANVVDGSQQEDNGEATSERSESQNDDNSEQIEQDQDNAEESGDRPPSNDTASASVATRNDEAAQHPLNGRQRGRRKKVYWTSAEVDCLYAGVEKFGAGNWKLILEDGRGVFLEHRTNVDLKDKWKNIHFDRPTRQPKRQRQHEPQEEVNEVGHEEDANEVEAPSDTNAKGLPRRKAAMAADQGMVAMVAAENENFDQDSLVDTDDNQLSGIVTLNLATDESFPQFIDYDVNVDACKVVSALKQRIRSKLLPSASRKAEMQIVGLRSRRLLDDNDQITHCISENGPEFFIVFEEGPEAFV